ncbi:flagellar biosynthetic protein FliO [Dactylosporangium sp. NPDC051485]|uniref:flagellar biosynthetic protein FliO n=1 Tax=Dactylosporangium sp. NPDC051485 TaxID=3154846 RepID=UPI003412FD44
MIELVLRVMFSLTVVVAILWALARLVRRPLGGRGGGTLTVVAHQQLSRGSSVAVVKVADRALVLGVTDAGVSLLADADAALFPEPAPLPNPVGQALKHLRGGRP